MIGVSRTKLTTMTVSDPNNAIFNNQGLTSLEMLKSRMEIFT